MGFLFATPIISNFKRWISFETYGLFALKAPLTTANPFLDMVGFDALSKERAAESQQLSKELNL